MKFYYKIILYGDFSLMQNETEIMYQIPLDLKCIENELYNNKVKFRK